MAFAHKRIYKISFGVLTIFLGICILGSNYYYEKKYEVFDDMNEAYYEQIVMLDEEVEEIENNITTKPNSGITTKPGLQTTTTRITQAPIDYTKYYVGYLSIPKISLKKGFTAIDNKYNTVNRNIQVIKPSDYPNVKNGNFIIAAHSGSSAVSFFKDLYKLNKNDPVYVTYKDKEYKYVIKDIYTVPKTGSISIKRNMNKTTLTLITCTKGDNTAQTVYICELE